MRNILSNCSSNAGDTGTALSGCSLFDTCQKDLKPIPETIARLLHHGHSLLAGPPKLGKSYLALQLAHAVASGDAALGSLLVRRPGKVLYLALEDGERRLKARTQQLLGNEQPAWLHDIVVVYELPHGLDTEHGLDALDATLSNTDYELVIVDTYVKAFPGEAGARDLFKGEYKQLDRLTKLAEKHDLAILTVIHTRKPGKGEDGSSLVSVAGTGGRTAAADAILMLSGTSGKPTAKLTLISRDTEGFETSLARDPVTSGWKTTGGDGAAPRRRAGQAEISGSAGRGSQDDCAVATGPARRGPQYREVLVVAPGGGGFAWSRWGAIPVTSTGCASDATGCNNCNSATDASKPLEQQPLSLLQPSLHPESLVQQPELVVAAVAPVAHGFGTATENCNEQTQQINRDKNVVALLHPKPSNEEVATPRPRHRFPVPPPTGRRSKS